MVFVIIIRSLVRCLNIFCFFFVMAVTITRSYASILSTIYIILQENIITESNNYITPQESVIIITVTIIIIISLSCKYYRFRCSVRVVPSCGPFLHSSLSSLHPPSYNSSPRWLLSLLLSLFFIVILLVCKDKPCRFCCSLCLLSFLATVSARPSSPSSPSQL